MATSKSDDDLAVATTKQGPSKSGTMCIELALEGERLCKLGDCRAGVAFFQAAIQAGTEDLRTLSAIYSQLGNAYFYLGDYSKAMEYHKNDLTLARSMGDKLGEAKSSGNLGNALKVMGRFDEAVVCCKRHLDISRELKDKVSEARALYNLGNIFHANGKHLGRMDERDPGAYPDNVVKCLEEAVKYYEANLVIMKELDDIAAQGRAYGNLGNTNYLLGNFYKAINYHEERLKIALQFNDKSAERRANSNLGNCYIFTGEFRKAAEYYKKMLALAQELEDKAVEGQACYSLGNTYTLMGDMESAVEYHLQHYSIAKQLNDRVGEGRACWSLGNSYASLGNNEMALQYAKDHLEITKELGDMLGQTTARMNIIDLQKTMGISNYEFSVETMRMIKLVTDNVSHESSPVFRRYRVRRKSMERLNLLKLTPDKRCENINVPDRNSSSAAPVAPPPLPPHCEPEKNLETAKNEEESFFELLCRFQAERMNDQRCTLTKAKDNEPKAVLGKEGNKQTAPQQTDKKLSKKKVNNDLIDLIVDMQSRRMNEQRAELPGLITPKNARGAASNKAKKFSEFLTYKRLSTTTEQHSLIDEEDRQQRNKKTAAATIPDEDFFSLITRLQSGRMDDQRAKLKKQYDDDDDNDRVSDE